MIRKLKQKFILIFMIVTVVMLASVLVFTGVSTASRMRANARITLEQYIRPGAGGDAAPEKPEKYYPSDDASEDADVPLGIGPAKIPGGSDGEGQQRDRDGVPYINDSLVLVMQYDDRGNTIDTKGDTADFNLSASELSSIGSWVMKARDDFGTVDDYPLAYLRSRGSHGCTVALYDTTADDNNLRSVWVTIGAAFITGVAVFFLISLWLAAVVTRPVEEAWERQKNFTADASHELKTPLTVIIANTAILKHLPGIKKDPDACRAVKCIEEEGGHMTGLVNDIMFLAKSDSTGNRLTFAPVNLSDLCTAACLTFEAVAWERGITLDSDIAEGMTVTGDERDLTRLIRITLDNACKYTPDHGRITVTLKPSGSSHVEYAVNNTGAVIPREQLEHLFERFYRGDESRTRQKPGYGLGLSIADSIARVHHARLTARSSEDEGTTFVLRMKRQNR